MSEVSLSKLLSDECHWTSLMICQHWFMQWLGAVSHQAITWSSVDQDLRHYMVSLGYNVYPTLAREFQGFRMWGKFVFRTLELTDTPTNLANQVKVGDALDQSRGVQSRGPERAHQTMSHHGDRLGQIADFRHSFETINGLYLLFKCGIKTKTHFEWLLWLWSSLGQLNLEPTRPNGLMGCKVPTDRGKISVKEATHMGFYYIKSLRPDETNSNPGHHKFG